MTKDKYHIQRVSELKQHSSASFIIEWCAFFCEQNYSLFIFEKKNRTNTFCKRIMDFNSNHE